jgi:Spy/CpxP family protein refolding chaperone
MNSGQKLRLSAFISLLILSGVLISMLTLQWTKSILYNQPSSHESHVWLHHELNLSDEEQQAIDAFETGYQTQRKILLQTFNQRIENLAQILVSSNELNLEVKYAIHQLHEVHGELQELSITHYYQMISVLSPEKQEKLQSMAVEALSELE